MSFPLSSIEAWPLSNVSPKSTLNHFAIYTRAHLWLFKATVDPELGDKIARIQGILPLLSRSHPLRPMALYTSSLGQFLRHELLHQSEDLDLSILNLTEALLLPSRSPGDFGPNTLDILSDLASALIRRSRESTMPDDVNSAIRYLRFLREQTFESFATQRNGATESLIEALAIRTELGSGDAMRDIEDMIALCDELLALDTPEQSAIRYSKLLVRAFMACYRRYEPLWDRCVISLREASMRRSQSPALSLVLAFALVLRSSETLADEDFEEATTILNSILASQVPGDIDEYYQVMSSIMISTVAGFRSTVYEKPEYAEETMSRFRSIHRSPFFSDESRSRVIVILGFVANQRFRSFDVKEASALQESLSFNPKVLRPSPLVPLDASQEDVTKLPSIIPAHSTEVVNIDIRRLHERLSVIPPDTHDHRKCLEELVESYRTKYSLTNDLVDIEESIKYCRLLLDSTSPGGLSSCSVAISLATLLEFAFRRTHKIEDINECIGLLSGVLRIPAGQAHCVVVTELLLSSLSRRARLFLGRQDNTILELTQTMRGTFQAISEVCHLAAYNKYISIPRRLRYSCISALSLRCASHLGICSASVISTAYENAMSLMQEAVMFAPNVQLQHTHLAAMVPAIMEMPLEFASHLVDTGQLEQAIVTLERGRALLWSELRGLHTSIHHIAGVNLDLAEKFTKINRDLEKVTMSVLPSGSTQISDDVTEDCEGPDPFGRLLLEQRKLLEERDDITSQIRSLPGLQNFMMAPSFDTLRSAASHGPVIIINHSEWRSDILILLHDSPPSLIPTSDHFYDDANKLRNDLLDARKEHGLDSMEYDGALATVLEDLYNIVGRPVIDRLRQLNIPEQSRIWWCPTSVFCSLPLHAMGPIPSNDREKRYFSDLYIPSYTPTLSALIESRDPSTQSQSSTRPSLLLVAQPDRSLPGVKGEIKMIQRLDINVESLILEDATTSTVLEGLRHHKLVHFACHGNLEIGKPFDASFKLYGDDDLKLLDIVHSRLPTAQFAFLSACHTAEITEESIADEGLHLTAALQYCGFRSAVGTMWAMADTDGCDVARGVYRSMLSGNNEEPCYLRSAEALRDAVRELRDTKGVSLERWVNFVHYGA